MSRLQPPPIVRKHESGLRVQEVTGPEVRTIIQNVLSLPPCCPVSGNPREGSKLVLTYIPAGWCLEVYSLNQLGDRFRGGWRGSARYPSERNMEGMIRLIVQMAADALGVPVSGRADLVLDTGAMRVRAKARPQVLISCPACEGGNRYVHVSDPNLTDAERVNILSMRDELDVSEQAEDNGWWWIGCNVCNGDEVIVA